MEKLDVREVLHIARKVAAAEGLPLEIVGAHHEGGSDYVELLVKVEGCRVEPCRFAVGVFRNLARREVEIDIAQGLARHLEHHSYPPHREDETPLRRA